MYSSSPTSSSSSPWRSLPEDVFLLVFSLLDPVSLSRAARVCRLWRQIVASKTLWREVRLPYVSKQKLRQFISRRMDVDCKRLSISGSCVLPTDNSSGLKTSAVRKCILTATVIELLQSKAPLLEALEIRRDNLATAFEVALSDLVELKMSSLSLTECYVAKEWFMGGSRLSVTTLDRLSCLDLSGSNRFDDFFLCSNCDVAYAQIIRLELHYKTQQEQMQQQQQQHHHHHQMLRPTISNADVQDLIPTHELPDAQTMFLLKFPNLRTLKLNRLYRLTARGVKMLTSCYDDGGKRVSLRKGLLRMELMENGLGDDSVVHLKSLTALRHLRLDGPQAMTPASLEHLSSMTQLESLSVDKMIDANKIADSLGLGRADETMDRLLFRILQNLKNLNRFSFFGLFATWPPVSAMKLTWPFILEHLPKLESVSFCERRHFLTLRRAGKAKTVPNSRYCRVCWECGR